MKKLFSILLCFILIASCTGLAEEATREDLMNSFLNKFLSSLQAVDPGSRALRLRVSSPDGTGLAATLQQEAEVYDLLVTSPDPETQPIRFQTDGDNIWFSSEGEVYTLRLSDLAAMASGPAASSLPAVDTDVLSEIAQLFVSDVLLPAVSAETPDENTRVIRLSLTAKQLYESLAVFGDQVTENDRYTEVLSQLIGFFMSPDQGSITPEVLRSQWPALRENILSEETDFTLRGTLTLTSSEEGTLFSCDLTLESRGNSAVLTADGSVTPRSVTCDASLSQTMGTASVKIADLDVDVDLGFGTLNACAVVPQTGYEVRLTASKPAYLPFAPLQAALTVLRGSEQVFAMDLNGFFTRYVYSLNATAGPLSAHIYKDRAHFDLSLQDGTNSLTARAFFGKSGDLPYAEAVLNTAYDAYGIKWDGENIIFTEDDDYRTVFAFGFESDSLFAVDITMEPVVPDPENGARHARLEAALKDEGPEILTVTAISVDGESYEVLVLETTEKTEVPLLSGQEATVIDQAWLMENLPQYTY